MIDKFAFLFSEGIKTLMRNRLANFLCLITIFINFSILGTFFVIGFNTDSYINIFRTKYTFEVFFVQDVDQKSIDIISNTLEQSSVVQKIELVDKDDAAEIFNEEFGEDIESLIGYNPLPISLRVNLSKTNFDLDQVQELVNNIQKELFVDEINYRGSFIKDIEDRINLVLFGFLLLVIGILFISIQMISNTIRLSINSRKKFIDILKYNGATPLFTKTPFYIESFILSVCGSAFAFLFVSLVFNFINSYLMLSIRIDNNLWIWMVSFSIIVGFYASSKSLNKFLN